MTNYEIWLRQVKGMLLSTGLFNDNLVLDKKAWRPLFNDGYTPYQAIQIDFGGRANPQFGESIPVSAYWETFLDD